MDCNSGKITKKGGGPRCDTGVEVILGVVVGVAVVVVLVVVAVLIMVAE